MDRKAILFFLIVTRGGLILLSAAYIALTNWSYLLALFTFPRSIFGLVWWIFNFCFFISNFCSGYFFYNIGYFCILKIVNLKYGGASIAADSLNLVPNISELEDQLRRKYV